MLNVKKRGMSYLAEAPDGAMRIAPCHSEFERQMAIAEAIMHEDREILKLLAK